MQTRRSKIARLITLSVFVLIAMSMVIMPAATAFAVENPATVPVGTGEDPNSIMTYLKNFTLDHLASLAAKEILHEMTLKTVDWINSGFHGSPAFLTNPESFFTDVGDQITGAFIAGSGPLQALCSPFSLDIRLNLALNQTSLVNQRYTCTLSSVIKNVQKSHVGLTVGNNPNGATVGSIANGSVLSNPNAISVNGASIDTTAQFMSGDFSQGGWMGFLALATEPQNNTYGAYLQARSDIQQQIAAKQAAANNDLNRGHGFLSWQQCDDVATVGANPTDAELATANKLLSDPSVSGKINNDGGITYQRCKSQTPGSVLAGSLQKGVDSSATQLELANDINSVANALIAALVNQIMQKGLGSLSAGGNASFTNQLRAEQTQIYNQEVSRTQKQASVSLSQSESAVIEYKSTYDMAVSAVTDSRGKLEAARACFVGKTSSTLGPAEASYALDKVAAIDSLVSSDVDPLLATLQAKQSAALNQLTQVQNLQAQSTAQIHTSDDVQTQTRNYENAVTTATTINANAQANLTSAHQDLANAQTKAASYNRSAADAQSACDQFPDITSVGSSL